MVGLHAPANISNNTIAFYAGYNEQANRNRPFYVTYGGFLHS